MYSNRQGVNLYINEENNGKSIEYPFLIKPLERILITLQDFQMPYVLDNITTLNNRIKITHALAGVIDVYIPIGQYNAIELRDKINDLLSPHITMTYAKHHYTFVSTHIFTIETETTCRKIIGLGSSFPYTATLYPAYTLVMPKKANLKSSEYITIRIPELNVNLISPDEPSNTVYTRIPVNVDYGQSLFYRPSIPYTFLLRKPNIQLLTLNLFDDLGNKLSNDFTCNLKIDYVYVPQDQEIHEEAEEIKDDLPFTHTDGNIKIKPFINKGGFVL